MLILPLSTREEKKFFFPELYCALDVGILAEVFTQFRAEIYSNFQLDATCYISTPQVCQGFVCVCVCVG
jgi:hypothetical protein